MNAAAREFAIVAHGEQRYGSRPYVAHLDEVAEIVFGLDPGETATAIAYLHDVLEDTSALPEDIERQFGPFVRECVELLTDPAGETRKERKRILHERLRGVPESHHLALAVKAADRLANLRNCARDNPSLYAMYRQEHAAFREAAFRPGLCDALWAEMERTLRNTQA